jgi:hypothetical protein
VPVTPAQITAVPFMIRYRVILYLSPRFSDRLLLPDAAHFLVDHTIRCWGRRPETNQHLIGVSESVSHAWLHKSQNIHKTAGKGASTYKRNFTQVNKSCNRLLKCFFLLILNV